MRRRVAQYLVPDVSKDYVAFVFKGLMDLKPLNINAIRGFETSGPIHPTTQTGMADYNGVKT
jgi:hypothetical protein